MTLYTFHVYNIIEILFALTTTIARKFVQIELEQPFNKPYLSTSCKTSGEELMELDGHTYPTSHCIRTNGEDL
jgi:hypothetical protein